MTLEKAIADSRDIKPNSLKLYCNNLKKINHILTGEKEIPDDIEQFKDYDKVIKAVNSLDKITTRKNVLTAVIVALTSVKNPDEALQKVIDKYQKELKEQTQKYNDFLLTQKKTKAQEENWLDYEEVLKILTDIGDEIKDEGLTRKAHLTNDEFDKIQNYVILSTYMFLTLRNDFAEMPVMEKDRFSKIPKNIKVKNNYLILDGKKKKFVLNVFKNVEKIGPKTIEVPNKLNKIINMWLKINKSGWYLVKKDRKTPLKPNDITKALNKIFKKRADGKKIGSSMLRHIVISHKLKGQPSLQEQQAAKKEVEDTFLHSKGMNDLYRKI